MATVINDHGIVGTTTSSNTFAQYHYISLLNSSAEIIQLHGEITPGADSKIMYFAFVTGSGTQLIPLAGRAQNSSSTSTTYHTGYDCAMHRTTMGNDQANASGSGERLHFNIFMCADYDPSRPYAVPFLHGECIYETSVGVTFNGYFSAQPRNAVAPVTKIRFGINSSSGFKYQITQTAICSKT